jgi:hypothetical protein
VNISESVQFIILIVLFVAENDALRKTLAAKEHTTITIPRPEKGIAGNGFNLQEAMGLADDMETYTLLRVSSLTAHTYLQLAHNCSALYGTWPLKQGSTVRYCGTANQKTLSAK